MKTIYSYIKFNIIAYSIMILFPIILFFSATMLDEYGADSFVYIFCLVLLFIDVFLYVVGIVIGILQYIKLKLYIDYKFYTKEYKKILKKYTILFLIFLSISLILGTFIVVMNYIG